MGSDEQSPLTDSVLTDLRNRGMQIDLFGALTENGSLDWPEIAENVATSVAIGKYDHGILFCWTGTGVCMAANKIPGIRAALCTDSESTRGARIWNDANVLCMSLRLTSTQVAKEIIEMWFLHTSSDPSERHNIARLNQMNAVTYITDPSTMSVQIPKPQDTLHSGGI